MREKENEGNFFPSSVVKRAFFSFPRLLLRASFSSFLASVVLIDCTRGRK